MAAFVAVGYFHLSRNQTVAAAREARANVVDRGPRVEVVAASQGPSERTVTMLADVRANTTAIMYAKVSGYMKSVLVDRGDRVQAGQVIAVIELPEIDQQYNAAVTDLEHKRRNLARSQELLAKGNTTQVAMLQFETDARVAEANVKGLETMKGYQTLRAPFAGRVTARYVDPGTLITNAQTNYVSALPIMTISDDSRLRVYCYVQQQDVPFINVGDTADVDRRQQSRTPHEGQGVPHDRRARDPHAHHADRDQHRQHRGLPGRRLLRQRDAAHPDQELSANSGERTAGAAATTASSRWSRTTRCATSRSASQTTDGNTVTVAEGLRQGDRDRDQPAGRDHRRRQGAADPQEVAGVRGSWPACPASRI